MNLRTMLLAGALAACAAPATAAAATPADGTIGPDSAPAQKTTWTGSITDPIGAYDLAMFFNGSTAVRGNDTCTAPLCDVYTLHVREGGQQVRIQTDAPAAGNVDMDITAPDGTRANLNTADTFTNRTYIFDAEAGDWTVRVYGSGVFDYTTTAEINLPGDDAFTPPDDGSDATG